MKLEAKIKFYSKNVKDIKNFVKDRNPETYEIDVETGGIYVVRVVV